jgi:hypothetical protein
MPERTLDETPEPLPVAGGRTPIEFLDPEKETQLDDH